MTGNLKTPDCRASGMKFGTMVVVMSIWGTFGLLVFKVILRSFGVFVSE